MLCYQHYTYLEFLATYSLCQHVDDDFWRLIWKNLNLYFFILENLLHYLFLLISELSADGVLRLLYTSYQSLFWLTSWPQSSVSFVSKLWSVIICKINKCLCRWWNASVKEDSTLSSLSKFILIINILNSAFEITLQAIHCSNNQNTWYILEASISHMNILDAMSNFFNQKRIYHPYSLK